MPLSLLNTAASAAKIAFLLIGVALSAKLVVPRFLALLSSSVPRLLWDAALLLVVHFIIVIVWRLQGSQPSEKEEEEQSLVAAQSPDSTVPTHDHVDSLDSCPDEIQLATEPVVDIKESVEQRPWPPPPEAADETGSMEDTWKAIAGSRSGGSAEPRTPSPEDEHDDSMDATWKAIMGGGSAAARPVLKKSDTWERAASPTVKEVAAVPRLERAPAPAPAPEFRKSKTFRERGEAVAASSGGWRGREVLVGGNDELFRKVEAFIKMNYEQMRIQRQESERRRRFAAADQMVPAAY